LRRWKPDDEGLLHDDRRPDADRPVPSHALSETERAQIIAVANEPRFAETPPARIVPALADDGIYIASESSFHRVLRGQGQMNRRGRAQPPRTSRPPTTHIATRPAEVWCWDVTFLPAQIQGRWFYLYLILDLYSRKIVGFEVHDTDSADHAAHLARRTALAEGIHAMPTRPVLHGDNGAPLKATTVLAMLHWLGIKPSYSRPRVSDDNAFAEALFRTVKYRPEFPSKGFVDLDAARQWTAWFVQWYNVEHRHSGIRYVTPAQRHAGQDRPLLEARHAVYQDAGTQPKTLEPADPKLDADHRRHAQSGARYSGPSGNFTNPAFRFDRHTCFPAPTWQRLAAARSGGDGRSGATRSQAQHREDGEHRTFPAVSTVASSALVGGTHRRETAGRIRQSLRTTSGNLFDTHRPSSAKMLNSLAYLAVRLRRCAVVTGSFDIC
jgi:transposase InsO family protein